MIYSTALCSGAKYMLFSLSDFYESKVLTAHVIHAVSSILWKVWKQVSIWALDSPAVLVMSPYNHSGLFETREVHPEQTSESLPIHRRVGSVR